MDTTCKLNYKEIFASSKTSFQEFIKNNFFDAEVFFRSVAIPDAPYYLYFGDLQSNLYYISDNMRDDFYFPDNVVPDLIEKWAERIRDPQDRALYYQDLNQMMEKKNEGHSLRYRVTDKNNVSRWVHCRGIVVWSDDKSTPLFFSGCVSRLENDFAVDSVTSFLREQAALNDISARIPTNTPALIIGFGLNYFSNINESKGRATGDDLLRLIASSLNERFNDEFSFYRLDGIRFMAVSRYCCTMNATQAVEAIHQTIDECYSRHKIPARKAAAFGVLRFPENGAVAHEILENTLSLITFAKTNSDKEYCEFSEDLITQQKQRSDISLELSKSVERECEDFRVVIQPIVSRDSGSIIGGETLLRWKYNGKDIPPSVFIPLLEETHLILTVGKWVFAQAVAACRQILALQPDFFLSFNVSYLQVLDDTFLPFLQKTLEESGVPGRCLMLELTESHFDEMPRRLLDFVEKCHELGITFALDDFGNGFSSLQMLFKYPVDVIKLDRTLMNEITNSSQNLDFIMSIVYACHRSKKRVCVEGVETNAELNIVRKTECDMIQGFYFHKPLELHVLFQLLLPSSQ